MRLDEELDAELQAVGRGAGHLLRDAVAQVQPQRLALAAPVLQAEVIRFDNPKLLTHLH